MALEKPCKHCRLVKPLAEFYGERLARDGYRPECKACTAARRKAWYEENREREIARVKEWQQANPERVNKSQRMRRGKPEVKARERDSYLQRKYGITQADYEALLAKQGGRCAICRRKPSGKISLHVDHVHATGRVRGLLCFRCNNAVGDFNDSVARLQSAIGYLTPQERDPAVLRRLDELKALAAQR